MDHYNDYYKIDELDYRDIHIDFFSKYDRQEVFALITDNYIPLGLLNSDYKADMKKIIDLKLDTIKIFQDRLAGGRLLYFDNADSRDIKLIYGTRLLKVYIKEDLNYTDTIIMDHIIQDAERFLDKYINYLLN